MLDIGKYLDFNIKSINLIKIRIYCLLFLPIVLFKSQESFFDSSEFLDAEIKTV